MSTSKRRHFVKIKSTSKFYVEATLILLTVKKNYSCYDTKELLVFILKFITVLKR